MQILPTESLQAALEMVAVGAATIFQLLLIAASRTGEFPAVVTSL